MTDREELIEKAEDAIDAVFSDMSVTQQTTLDDLGGLLGLIESLIQSIKDTMEEK